MQAVILRNGALHVGEVGEPALAPGLVRAQVIACGICGSDLHCVRHTREFVDVGLRSGMTALTFDPERDLVMGHELTARILEVGPPAPDGRGPVLAPGDAVAVMPVLHVGTDVRSLGYSNDFPGGYAERVVVEATSCVSVPAGADAALCALTEPAAVGLHAANQATFDDRTGAVVVGCGPVGLMIVAALAYHGVGPVVAADFSPVRRDLAAAVGAHHVTDPRAEPAIEAWRRLGPPSGRDRVVVFDAVGVPGTLAQAMQDAPYGSEVVVAGLCMPEDRIWPAMGINKHLTVRFVLGWTRQEFAECLAAIASGRLDVAPVVTGRVGLEQVPAMFEELARPDHHAKVLVTPA